MTQIAVFASGRGSNFRTIFTKIKEGYLFCQVSALISDNLKADALEFAEQNDISTYVVKPREFPTPDSFGKRLIEILTQHQVEYILLRFPAPIPETI